jgi:hypothetical protein
VTKISVTIEGELEEVREALRVLSEANSLRPAATASVLDQAPPPAPRAQSDWTERELEEFWRWLTADAQEVLAEIAKRPEGHPFQEVGRALSLDMSIIGGRLSSLGHALRRPEFEGKTNPLVRDWARSQYRIDPWIAAIFRRLADDRR